MRWPHSTAAGSVSAQFRMLFGGCVCFHFFVVDHWTRSEGLTWQAPKVLLLHKVSWCTSQLTKPYHWTIFLSMDQFYNDFNESGMLRACSHCGLDCSKLPTCASNSKSIRTNTILINLCRLLVWFEARRAYIFRVPMLGIMLIQSCWSKTKYVDHDVDPKCCAKNQMLIKMLIHYVESKI